MQTKVRKVARDQEERVIIECYQVDHNIKEIIRFIEARQNGIAVIDQEKKRWITLSDIYYVEAVEDRVFAYLKKEVYEIKLRLYEFEAMYGDGAFFRCSKSVIVNLMKIDSIAPALNGRFLALLTSNETVIISRKYVPELKRRLRGE